MGKRILIVDDSSMMRKMLKRVLEPAGHTIIGEAKNGLEAIELYQELEPDLVTMDITMKGMDGVTAAGKILHEHPAARIVFLSNLNEDKYRDDVEKLGALGFINKHKSEEILDLINTIENQKT